MRIAVAIPLLLLSAAFFQQCKEEKEEYDIILSIPKEDRFVYKSGDLLLYSCDSGSSDTVEIKEARFWTDKGTFKDWTGQYKYSYDYQSIGLEMRDREWKNALYYVYPYDNVSFKGPCFLIATGGYDMIGLPTTFIANGCNYPGEMNFGGGEVSYRQKSINDSIYQNVYSCSYNHSDTAKVEILWNLKYGVIRFSEYISGNWKQWTLEGPL
ncbi:MAG: hypothetical protein R6W31_15755 [Bacteroidales bacterium]